MKVLTILGGTGVFGSRIATDLASIDGVVVRVVGQDRDAGAKLAEQIAVEFRAADVADSVALPRAIDGSHTVIHAAGPFQSNDHFVARTCIQSGCHYLDLADARAFVCGIGELDAAAKNRGVFVTSGASTVPAITSALIRDLQSPFHTINSIQIALSPGNQNPRGASTIAAILTYLGRPIRVWQDGAWINRPGWGDPLHLEFPPPVGRRRVHNCDVPDLALFPNLFRARTVRFHAGVELPVINRALSALAMVRKIVPMPALHKSAGLFLRASLMLYRYGSKNGSLSIWMHGTDHAGSPIEHRIAIVTDDDGPATPCSPSIILARKLLSQGPPCAGASPCLGFISVDEIASHLQRYGVWIVRGDHTGWFERGAAR